MCGTPDLGTIPVHDKTLKKKLQYTFSGTDCDVFKGRKHHASWEARRNFSIESTTPLHAPLTPYPWSRRASWRIDISDRAGGVLAARRCQQYTRPRTTRHASPSASPDTCAIVPISSFGSYSMNRHYRVECSAVRRGRAKPCSPPCSLHKP